MTQTKISRTDAARHPCKWRVVATVDTPKGKALRAISGWFVVHSAAEEYARMAQPEFPDAHTQAKRESRKLAAAIDGYA